MSENDRQIRATKYQPYPLKFVYYLHSPLLQTFQEILFNITLNVTFSIYIHIPSDNLRAILQAYSIAII